MEDLMFKCRFNDDSVCVKPSLKKKKEEMCKHDSHQDRCKFYELPLNVVFFDTMFLKMSFQCSKNHGKDLADIKVGKGYCKVCEKEMEGKLFPNEKKEAVFRIINRYTEFDEFYFICGLKFDKERNLIGLNEMLKSTRLFDVGEVENGWITNVSNYCNKCGYCNICKKIVKFKFDGKIIRCEKCNNPNIKRKVFNRKSDKCPNCNSKDFMSNTKWRIKFFKLKKTSLNL